MVEVLKQHGLPLIKAILATTTAECQHCKQYRSMLSVFIKPCPVEVRGLENYFVPCPSLGGGAAICPIEIDTHSSRVFSLSAGNFYVDTIMYILI